FNRHRRVLDLGGGNGSLLTEVLSQYDRVEATLYELPTVAAATRRRLNDGRFADRLRIVPGDFFKDPIPDGHDAVIIANVVHCFPRAPVLELLRRTRQQVAAGARLLLADFWTDETHTHPTFAALMAGEFLLTPGGGDVYSAQEAREWLRETGWRQVELRPLAGPARLIVAVAGPAKGGRPPSSAPPPPRPRGPPSAPAPTPPPPPPPRPHPPGRVAGCSGASRSSMPRVFFV